MFSYVSSFGGSAIAMGSLAASGVVVYDDLERFGMKTFRFECIDRSNSLRKYSIVFRRPIFSGTRGSQLRIFLARAMSGFRLCGSSSTAGIVSILLVLPPTRSRIINANSGMKINN